MRYRLLNDPEQAESICLDILDVEPDNQEALVTLILALTDQFGVSEPPPSVAQVRSTSPGSPPSISATTTPGSSPNGGLVRLLRGSMGHSFAFEAFREAMTWFEKAAAIRPEDDDEALLRWNACVRTIRRHRLQPRAEEPESQLE